MPETITSRFKISPWQIALCFALCCVVAMIAAGSFAKFNDKVSANEKQKPNKTRKIKVAPNSELTPEESKQLSQMYSELQNPNGERGNSTRTFSKEERYLLEQYAQGVRLNRIQIDTLLSRILFEYYYRNEPQDQGNGYHKKKALLAQYAEFVRQQGRRILDAPRANDKRPAGNAHINPNAAGGPDAFGYTFRDSNEAVNPPAFQFIDISATGTALNIAGSMDSGGATVTLGGPGFNFYGTTVNTVVALTDGYISTNLAAGFFDFSNDCPLPAIPSSGGAGARLYALHDDLNSTNIRHQYFATSPRPADNGPNTGVNVISWINSDFFGGGIDAFTFQVLLYDNGDIVYQYGPGNPQAGSGSTTGIQNDGATIGLTYACNTAATLANGLAVLFSTSDGGGGGDCEPCTPDSNAFTDPSLEQEDTFWTSTSTNFGTGFCTIDNCGTGTGTGPRTGDVWWWGGGTDSAEVTTLSQDVTIPTGTTATLNFFLEIPVTETPFDATMVLTVDGDTINTYTEPSTGAIGYTLQTFDLSAYADGGTHTILFTYNNPTGSGTSNFFIDDLQLEIVCPPCEGECTNPNIALLVADTTNSRVQKFTVGDGMPSTSDVGPINGTFGTGDPGCPSFTTGVQDGRIFRDGVASVCPSKAYPGIFGVGTNFNFDAYTFVNNMAATQCITVNFDPDSPGGACGTNAHASAYLTSYNPADQATNYVGDVGSSTTQPFSFEVPANGTFLVVVTNTASQATCNYQFTVVGDVSCGEGAPQGDWSVLMPAGTTAGKVKNPKGVTQTSDGVNIYVADTGNNRIQKSTDSGVTWAVLPNTTAAPLGFKSPAAVAVEPDDPNIVYVADTGNNRVLASSDGGATWSLLAGTGSNPNQVRGPEGMVVDCDGNLWIADTLNNRIVAYAAPVAPPRGTRVAVTPGTGVVVAGFGSALNQVRAPKGVTVDVLTGDLYVADTANNRITHYINGPVLSPVALTDASLVAPTGSALGQVRGPAGITVSGGAPEMMARRGFNPKVANTGVVSLVIGDTMNNRIQRAEIMTVTQVGTFSLVKGSTATQTATVGSLVGQFRAPTGVR